jgi:hypothetical protein
VGYPELPGDAQLLDVIVQGLASELSPAACGHHRPPCRWDLPEPFPHVSACLLSSLCLARVLDGDNPNIHCWAGRSCVRGLSPGGVVVDAGQFGVEGNKQQGAQPWGGIIFIDRSTACSPPPDDPKAWVRVGSELGRARSGSGSEDSDLGIKNTRTAYLDGMIG